MRDVIILAAGPSVLKYNLRDLEKRGFLIAVNGAAAYSKPQVALTMDRKVAEFFQEIWRVQGVPKIYLRSCIVRSFTPADNMILFQNTDELDLTDEEGKLNGDSSGTCALNLAYQMRPERIFLIGYDMQRGEENRPYWFPPYEWNVVGAARNGTYGMWAKEYQTLRKKLDAANISVFNVNYRSVITTFPQISFEQFLEMTK